MSRKHHKRHRQCQDHYSDRQVHQIEIFYASAVFLWILLCYTLGVYKARSPIAYMIVTIPVIIYAIAFLNAARITRRVERMMLSTDFLAFGLLFVSVLFEMRRHGRKDYTVRIIVVSFILLILSTVDVWTGERTVSIARHIRSAARTAAVTLLIFVIYVNVTNETEELVAPTDPTIERTVEIETVLTPEI